MLRQTMIAPDPEDYDGLIFDCDGTLVHTMPAHYASWCAALHEVGISLAWDRFLQLAGMSTVETVETLAREQGVACDAEAVARDKDRRYRARSGGDPPIAPVVAIARRMHGRKKLAVASGNVTDIVRETLRGAGIDDLFSIVVGADQVARAKPAPDLFLLAASLLDAPPARCLVFEDGDLGIEAARAAGMGVIDIRPLLSHDAQSA